MSDYFIKKLIDNNVIKEVQKMLSEGKTYAQIKEKTGVSDGTIARIKQGKVTPNRKKSVDIDIMYTKSDIDKFLKHIEILKSKIDKLEYENNNYKKLFAEFKKYGLDEKYIEIKKSEKQLEKQRSKFNDDEFKFNDDEFKENKLTFKENKSDFQGMNIF